MRTVLYSDEDFEPITVIDVPEWMMKMIRSNEVVRLSIPLILPTGVYNYDPVEPVSFRDVHIFGERLRRNNQESWLMFTKHDELAMLLKSTYLPGQRGDLAKQRKEAFVEGIVHAISIMGD